MCADKSFLSCRTKWQRSPYILLPGICADFFQTCAISAGFELRERDLAWNRWLFLGDQTLTSQSCACFSTKNETIRAYKASFFIYYIYIYTQGYICGPRVVARELSLADQSKECWKNTARQLITTFFCFVIISAFVDAAWLAVLTF